MTRSKLITLAAPLVLGLAVAGAAGTWLVARTRGRLEEDLVLVLDLLVSDLRRAAETALTARAAAEDAEIDEMKRVLESLSRFLGTRPPGGEDLADFRANHELDGVLVVDPSGAIRLASGWGGPDGTRGGQGLARRLGPLLEGRLECHVERDHRTRFGERTATIVAVRLETGGALVARRTRPLRDPHGVMSLEAILDRLVEDERVAWAEIRSGPETVRRGSDARAVVVASRTLPTEIAGPDVTVRLGLAPGPAERRLADERRHAAIFGLVLLGATALIGVVLFGLAVRSERRLGRMRADVERAARLAALGHVGAGLAHEIRNPLNALRLALVRLRAKSTDPDLDRYAGVAEEEIARLEDVVRRTLAWARDEDAGPRVALDLEDAVRGSVHREGVSGVEIDAEPARASVAPDALDHVLRNLVRNSREAGSSIRIEIRGGPPPTVIVEDDGPGWPPDLRDRLGQPFVTTREDGAGLGLYLSRRLVEKMGGRLVLEDRPGGGARVVVELTPVDAGGQS